jgi:hypothetical protein
MWAVVHLWRTDYQSGTGNETSGTLDKESTSFATDILDAFTLAVKFYLYVDSSDTD